jgi:hypothetical protein
MADERPEQHEAGPTEASVTALPQPASAECTIPNTNAVMPRVEVIAPNASVCPGRGSVSATATVSPGSA